MQEAECEDQRFWGSQALYSAEHLSQLELDVITYIVVGLPYSIFQISIHFLAISPTYEMLRWASMMDHDLILDYSTIPCHDWVSGNSNLRTDVVLLAICRGVIDAQSYISVFSLGWCWFKWIICMFMTQLIYLVLWLSLLLYSFLWHVLTFSVMIWRSYKYVDLDVLL